MNFIGVIFASTITWALLILVHAAPSSTTSSTSLPKRKFAVIVDAGSSGSRIYVYQYDPRDEIPDLKPISKNGKSWNYKTEPGISTLAGKLDQVQPYVGDLIQHLKDELTEDDFPRSSWASTPFMWFATAGMRMLDDEAAHELTEKIREIASDKALVPFQFLPRMARTLSGEEEGAFAWISLNYINGFFNSGEGDYGVVETGGASSQMTFRADGDILSNKFNVIIDRVVYPLYTHSFLYFGQDQIIKRVFRTECLCLARSKDNCRPCVVNGQLQDNGEVLSSCLLKNYRRRFNLTIDESDFEVTLVGSGDPVRCASVIDSLFKADYFCFTKPCSFAGVYQPAFGEDKLFYGTSAIRYTVQDLGLSLGDHTFPQIRQAADAYLKRDQAFLATADRYAWTRGLVGIFVAKEFEHLRFSENHKVNIAEFDTWTVGAVLYQLELMEISFPDGQKTYDDHNSGLVVPSSSYLMISCLLFLFFKSK